MRVHIISLFKNKPGPVAQLVERPIACAVVMSSIPARFNTTVWIDYDIFSTAIILILQSASNKFVSVTHEVLLNRIAKLAQEKVCLV